VGIGWMMGESLMETPSAVVLLAMCAAQLVSVDAASAGRPVFLTTTEGASPLCALT
jgi:hypothetical protein